MHVNLPNNNQSFFMLHSLIYSASTETGLVRKNNQDAFYASPEHGLVVVADGMGGHKGGEIASEIAVHAIAENLEQQHWDDNSDEMQVLLKLGAAVEVANQMIRQRSQSTKELSGMGTTVVVALFIMGRVFLAHVGDSRIYRFRDNKLEQLTRDHSLVQQLIDSGAFLDVQEAEAAGIRTNVLTRGLGIEDQAEVDVSDEVLQPDDLFLFCTDGLTAMVRDGELEKLLQHYQGDIDTAVERLIVGAMSAGGLDNITVVLARPEFE